MKRIVLQLVALVLFGSYTVAFGDSEASRKEARAFVDRWAKTVGDSDAVSAVYRHGDSLDHSWVVYRPSDGMFVVASSGQIVAMTPERKYLWKRTKSSTLREMEASEREGKQFDALLDPFMSGPLVSWLSKGWDKWVVDATVTGDRMTVRVRLPNGMRYFACETSNASAVDKTVAYTFSLDGRLLETAREGDEPRLHESSTGDPVGLIIRTGDYSGAGTLVYREVPSAAEIRELNEAGIGRAYVEHVVRPSESFTLRVPDGVLVRENESDGKESRLQSIAMVIACSGIAVLVVAGVTWIRSRRA
ncbi:MAG: hypothetical protein JNM86_14100 [Phycisphaerae bacterium]|nr:hypothetical protein [Phycisphaerae bacterium]